MPEPKRPTVELRGAVGRLWDGIEADRLPPALLIDGPAGTGKTLSILLCLHLWSLNRPGLRILIARKTRESLTESVLVTYEQQVLPITGHEAIAAGILRRVRQSYRYPNGTEWIVGGLDKPSRILSTSFDLGFINEAIEVNETDWETLDSRIGRPERSHGLNCLLGDTNPGDAAHFLKRKADAGGLSHWPSVHRDNPALWNRDDGDWTEAGRAYLDRLGRLTGSRRRRLLEGQWVAGEGAWFDSFDLTAHVTETAEFDPAYPVYEAIDPGVHTGCVWFQVDARWGEPRAWVVGDLYLFDVPAEQAARRIVARRHELVGGAAVETFADPAGKQANAIGPKVYEEYERGGLYVSWWPVTTVLSGLETIDALVSDTPPRLAIHPRCEALVAAFGNYRRKQVQGQWIDRPEDPQHPHEDLMDALRGGLVAVLGGGRGVSFGRPLFNPAYRG